MDFYVSNLNNDYEKLCHIIKEYRLSTGKEQKYIAKLLGISQPDYSRKESGNVIFTAYELKILSNNGLTIDSIFNVSQYTPYSFDTLFPAIKSNLDSTQKDVILKIVGILLSSLSEVKNNLNDSIEKITTIY